MSKDITLVHVPLLGYALLHSPLTFGLNWRQGKNSRIYVIREEDAPDLEEILARESQRGIAKSLLLGAGGVGGAVGAGTTYIGASAAAACTGGVCEIPAVAAGGAVAGSGAAGAAGLGVGAVLSILGWAGPAAYLFGLAYKRLGARHVIRRLHERIGEATTHIHGTAHLDEIIRERRIKLSLAEYHAMRGRMSIIRRGVEHVIPVDELVVYRKQLADSFGALARASRQAYHPHGDVMEKSYAYAKKHFERRLFKARPYLFFS